MTPLYIFDLDGTLALTDHRQHLVKGGDCPQCHGCGEAPGEVPCSACGGSKKRRPDWKAFFAACVRDLPNTAVIDTLHNLVDSGAEVWVWSGRSSEVMKQTQEWLMQHVALEDLALMMRVEGDFTPDEELKQSWLESMASYDRRRLVAVFDDRDKVVSMWRRNGVPCFQVAPGTF